MDIHSAAADSLTFRSTRRALGCLGIYALLAGVGLFLDRWFVWTAIWIVQAFVLLIILATIHECVHNHFVNGRRANHVIGVIAAAFAFTVFDVYRPLHALHHADTCGPNDPEGEPYTFTAKWQIVLAFTTGGLFYTLSLIGKGLAVSFGAKLPWVTSPKVRRRVRVNMVVLLVFVGAATAGLVFNPKLTLSLWIIPVLLSLAGPLPFVLIPEHYNAPGRALVTANTRTCLSNPVLRFVFLNTNLHTAHHSRSSVAWCDLPRQFESLEAQMDDEWIFPGYLAFHRFMWNTVGQTTPVKVRW
jgi:fatty acid desaturase